MTSTTRVELEWIFHPANFFEQKIEVIHPQFSLKLENGLAKAVADAATFDADSLLSVRIERCLRARLDAQKLVRHKPYQVGNAVQKRTGPDGQVHKLILADIVEVLVVEDISDAITRSADGKTTGDTHAKRLAADKSFGDRVSAHGSDPVLSKLMSSFAKAVDDPANELVHLYEIRDALAATFGGEVDARAELSLSKADWSRLGSLCNHEPLKQARHRGKDLSGSRDATAGELDEARSIARRLLDGYLEVLDRASPLASAASKPPPAVV